MRRITHQGQADNRDSILLRNIARDHIRGLEQLTLELDSSRIFNMDETPCYMDMSNDSTLDFVGNKNVDATNTGNDKSRFTVVLCICADGRILNAMVILKGLVHVPRCDIPQNIKLFASKGGSMNETLMHQWIQSVFTTRGRYLSTEPSLLIMDSHRSHYVETVITKLKSYNIKTKLVPPKTTPYLQPLDVTGGPNKVFKHLMRGEWQDWLHNEIPEYTQAGNRRRPSYQHLINMVSRSIIALNVEVIRRAFELCGVAARGAHVQQGALNHRLCGVLGNEGLDIRHESDEDDNDDDDSDDPFDD